MRKYMPVGGQGVECARLLKTGAGPDGVHIPDSFVGRCQAGSGLCDNWISGESRTSLNLKLDSQHLRQLE